MSLSLPIPYVKLLVPNAETEQEFLLLAVQAALIKYRASQHKNTTPPQMHLPTAAYSAEAVASAAKAGSYGVFGERE